MAWPPDFESASTFRLCSATNASTSNARSASGGDLGASEPVLSARHPPKPSVAIIASKNRHAIFMAHSLWNSSRCAESPHSHSHSMNDETRPGDGFKKGGVTLSQFATSGQARSRNRSQNRNRLSLAGNEMRSSRSPRQEFRANRTIGWLVIRTEQGQPRTNRASASKPRSRVCRSVANDSRA